MHFCSKALFKAILKLVYFRKKANVVFEKESLVGFELFTIIIPMMIF